MVCLHKNGNTITKGFIRAKVNGVIKTENDFNLFYKINGEQVLFPQKESCVLNMDGILFKDLNTIGYNFGLEGYLNSQYELFKGTNRIDVYDGFREEAGFGGNEDRTLLKLSKPECAILKGGAFPLNFKYKFAMMYDREFTFSILVKHKNNPTTWSNLVVLTSHTTSIPDSLRIEWNGSTYNTYGNQNDGTNKGTYTGINVLEYNQLIITVGVDKRLRGFLNGNKVFDTILGRQMENTINKIQVGARKRNQDNEGSGSHLLIKSMRFWSKSLTDQECMDLYKIDRLLLG